MAKSIHVLKSILLAVALAALFLPSVRSWAEGHRALYWVYLLVFAFLISSILMPLVIAGGFRFGILDHPDSERKHHTKPTPLTGGTAIIGAFILTLLVNFHFSLEMKAVLVASTLIYAVGLIDDKWGMSARLRLLFQVAVSLVLVYFGVRITFVPDFLGGVFTETGITILWLIGITNSMNFIDGMDGLAAGTSIIYSIFFALVALLTGQTYMMYLAVAIAGSCLGFFPYNFRPGRPALAFLGDSGSNFLGFLLACFAIIGSWGDSIVDLAVPVIIMSVLIFDMTLTTIVRIHSGEVKNLAQWIHYTGRDHFHHRLTDLGINAPAAAFLFFAVSVSFGLEAVALLFSSVWISLVILFHSILVFVIIGIILVRKNDVFGSRHPAQKKAG